MNWLTRLKNTECPGTHPTETTKTGFGGGLGVSVVFVGTPQARIANSLPVSEAANDPATHRPATSQNAPPPSSDAYCWPNSLAPTDQELDRFEARLKHFARRGLPDTQAEALADVLVIRDRTQDDRRCCLECSHCTYPARLWSAAPHRPPGRRRHPGAEGCGKGCRYRPRRRPRGRVSARSPAGLDDRERCGIPSRAYCGSAETLNPLDGR